VVATSGHHIVFRFEADGETHFSSSRRFGQLPASDPSSAGEVARLYPLGREVTVFYDPADPDLARYGPPALERRSFCSDWRCSSSASRCSAAHRFSRPMGSATSTATLANHVADAFGGVEKAYQEDRETD